MPILSPLSELNYRVKAAVNLQVRETKDLTAHQDLLMAVWFPRVSQVDQNLRQLNVRYHRR